MHRFPLVIALAAALALLAPPAPAADDARTAPATSGETDGRWDPWNGMERDGRIPAVAKPEPHPERWRYFPEGRLKPGNVLQRFMVSSFIAPFFFRDTDVGFGGGVALTDIDFRQQRRQEFAGVFLSYSAEGQQAYTAIWNRWLHHREAPGGGVFQEERSYLSAIGGYSRTLTRRFYGFGDDTPESAETSYTDETAFGGVGLQLALPEAADDFIVGGGVRVEWHHLGPGHVGDVPTTGARFPAVFDAARDVTLGWLRTEVRWDTTDSERLPYRGIDVGAVVDSALGQSTGDVGAVFTVDGSTYVPVPGLFHSGARGDEEHPPVDTLAFHVETGTTAGDLPFFALPTLGGAKTLRGYIAGRFRDRSDWAATAEYRFWILPRGFALSPWTPAVRVERLGAALFFDTGAVADEWWDLFRSTPRYSGGIGGRITLERSAPFRADIGFSEEGVQVTAGFGLSF